jgi:hypothetical protein
MPAGERTYATLAPEENGDGVTLEAIAALFDGHQNKKPKPRIPFPACHPIWLSGQIPLTGGAGTLTQGNLYGPEGSYWWDLRTVSLWGWTAGTVTVYLNNTAGEQIAQATTPGQFTWGAQILLGPQDNVIFGATGITGSVNVILRAIEVETAWLPEYLM